MKYSFDRCDSESYPPVFLLASERSGTNLLRKLFSQHQEIYFGPSPAHFLKWLQPRIAFYGDLSVDKNFALLVEDAIALCTVHFSPWEVELNADEIIANYSAAFDRRNAVLLSHFLQLRYATSNGYMSYFCKDNHLYDFVYLLLHEIPDSKFVYLHRDPRDFALSQKKRTLQRSDIVATSRLWKHEQARCLSALHHLGPDRVFQLSYENLIADWHTQIEQLCEFVGVSFRERPNQQYHAFSGKSQEWSNLDKPVMADNAQKYRKGLNKLEIKIVEAHCGSLMNVLGYQRDFPEASLPRLQVHLQRFLHLLHDRTIRQWQRKTDAVHAWSTARNRLLARLHV